MAYHPTESEDHAIGPLLSNESISQSDTSSIQVQSRSWDNEQPNLLSSVDVNSLYSSQTGLVNERVNCAPDTNFIVTKNGDIYQYSTVDDVVVTILQGREIRSGGEQLKQTIEQKCLREFKTLSLHVPDNLPIESVCALRECGNLNLENDDSLFPAIFEWPGENEFDCKSFAGRML